MMLPVIISTYNRLNLLQQTIESLRKNSDNELEIVVVDDASTDGTYVWLRQGEYKDIRFYSYRTKVTIAEVKEMGFRLASDSKYVYFSDDDVYFEPHWDSKLISVLETFSDIGVVGGLHHPHHQIFSTRLWKENTILICEQQAGYSLMLRREDYLSIGGYEVSERTAVGGEDTLICDMVKEKGKLVAAIDPPVIIHCGLRNYRGWKTADYNEMMKIREQRPEILFE